MSVKVGVVTIGQTPRIDLIPEIEKFIPRDIEIVERGALDGLTIEEVSQLKPKNDADAVVTRMRDGTSVTIGKSHVLSRLQERITELNEEEVKAIAMVCGAQWPRFESRTPLIMPYELLLGFLSAVVIEGNLGVMVPVERQLKPFGVEPFQELGFTAVPVAASPYGNEGKILDAAKKLKGKVDLTVLYCFGYDLVAKERVRTTTERPVILIRSLLARALSELVSNGVL